MTTPGVVALMPIQWTSLVHIAELKPVDDADASLMQELREVLIRRKATDRFGISLLHRHFDLSHDEVLMESTNETTRTSTIAPRQRATAGPSIVTAWKFSAAAYETQPIVGCTCPWDPLEGRHSGRHEKT